MKRNIKTINSILAKEEENKNEIFTEMFFEDMEISSNLKEALTQDKFIKSTRIQSACYHVISQNKNCVIQS